VFVYLGGNFHIGERTLERKEMYAHGRAGLGLQDQLIGDGTLVRLVRIALAVVDAGLHHPLLVEGREASRLVEKLVHILVRSIGFHLKIWKKLNKNVSRRNNK